MFYEEIRTKSPSLHISLLIKYSIQQQIHFNGNVFGNKCCRCNEGSLHSLNGKKFTPTVRKLFPFGVDPFLKGIQMLGLKIYISRKTSFVSYQYIDLFLYDAMFVYVFVTVL